MRCTEIADDLQSFVSGSLLDPRREAVAEHVASCPDCRATVTSLQALRRLVTSTPTAAAPSDLSRRLAAIAGEERELPLWLAKDAGARLPSGRAKRRRLVAMSGGFVMAAVGGAAALSWAYAPDTGRVSGVADLAGAELSSRPVASSSAQAVISSVSTTITLSPSGCPEGFDCPGSLAGLPLVHATIDDTTHHEVVTLVYSDGRNSIAVVQERGELDHAASGCASAQWQAGDIAIGISGSSAAVVALAKGQLPGEQAVPQGTVHRIRSGWQHLRGK